MAFVKQPPRAHLLTTMVRRKKQKLVIPLEERLADIEASMTRVPALPVSEAWEIANAWDQELRRGHYTSIGFRMDASAPLRVAQSFEWVHIVSLSNNNRDKEGLLRLGALLRAVCSTWTILASCPGYGGDENPVFWKYLISEWWDQYQPGISDATRFFTRHSFPRFRLDLPVHSERGEAAVLCRAFFGVDQPNPNAASQRTQNKFEELRERLMPLVDKKRLERPVEISLELSTDRLDSLVSAVSWQNNQGADGGIQFIQHEVSLNGIIRSYPPSHAQLTSLLATRSVEIPHMKFIEKYDDQKAYYDLINRSCNVHNCSTARVRSIEVSRDHVSHQEVAALCSALPHARSLQMVHYRGQVRDIDRNNISALMTPDWVWIGYALFHPDASISSWSELKLTDLTIIEDTVRILRAMAQGNNLLAILNGTPAVATAYFSATLALESAVYKHPSTSSSPIMHLNGLRAMDAVVQSTDLELLDEFVALVVPGLGLVYTRRENVIHLSERPPSPVSLTALHIEPRNYFDPITKHVPDLLKLLGSELQHLAISRFEKLAMDTIRTLLDLTPALQSLSIDVAGVLWSGSTEVVNTSPLPKLHELQISMLRSDTLRVPPELVLRRDLQELRALRVKITDDYYGDKRTSVVVLERSLASMVAVLRNLPELEYLHWFHRNVHGTSKQYAESRAHTWKKAGLGFSQSDREARAIQSFSPSCRRAVLSVVRSAPTSSALGQFNPDVLGLILGFATVYKHRDISIQRQDVD